MVRAESDVGFPPVGKRDPPVNVHVVLPDARVGLTGPPQPQHDIPVDPGCVIEPIRQLKL